MVARMGGEDVLVLLDRLGGPAVKALGEPVFGGAPDRVVRLCPDACFDVAVQRLEPVLDDGFGLAGDFAPDPLAVGVVSEADYSAPAAVAVPVAVAVTARHGELCSKKTPSSRHPRRELMGI
jgi:hypothetical protein